MMTALVPSRTTVSAVMMISMKMEVAPVKVAKRATIPTLTVN
jgi:hypothetical protein